MTEVVRLTESKSRDNMVLKQLDCHRQKKKEAISVHFIQYVKINSKNCRPKCKT